MIFEVKNLYKNFGEKEVLKGLTFSCESGQSIALLGRNGAGKTTLFRCVLDIFKHDSGEILIDGQPIDRKKIKFGYLPEERGLYLDRTVYEQMMYFGKLKGMKKTEVDHAMDTLLEKLDATQYKHSMLDSLSKGNKQKIQLAIAVINNPDIVIFDEPFSGLDPVSSKHLKNLIEETTKNGKIVIFSSHEMSYTEDFCENIAILHNGVISTSGKLKDIKNSYGRKRIRVLFPEEHQGKVAVFLEDIRELCTDIIGKNDSYYFHLKSEENIGKLQTLLYEKKYLADEFVVVKPSLEEIFVEKVGGMDE